MPSRGERPATSGPAASTWRKRDRPASEAILDAATR